MVVSLYFICFHKFIVENESVALALMLITENGRLKAFEVSVTRVDDVMILAFSGLNTSG
jgi:hypothetical protein